MTNVLNLFENAQIPSGTSYYGFTQDLLPFWLLALVVLIAIPAAIILLLSRFKKWLKNNCPKLAKVITITEIVAVIGFVYWLLIQSTPEISAMDGFWNYNPVFVFTVILLFLGISWLSYPGGSSNSKKRKKRKSRR
jgi:hypothetical protein